MKRCEINQEMSAVLDRMTDIMGNFIKGKLQLKPIHYISLERQEDGYNLPTIKTLGGKGYEHCGYDKDDEELTQILLTISYMSKLFVKQLHEYKEKGLQRIGMKAELSPKERLRKAIYGDDEETEDDPEDTESDGDDDETV